MVGEKGVEEVCEEEEVDVYLFPYVVSSLANCPTEDTMADPPAGLQTDLYPHQCRALAWLLWRETQTPSGGILGERAPVEIE